MNDEERNLDDLYNASNDLNVLARKYKYLLANENIKAANNDKLTVKDIMFSQKKIEQFESEFREAAVAFIILGENQKGEFQELIRKEDGLTDMALEFVFRAMSLNPPEWFSAIEKFVIEIVDELGSEDRKYKMVHLYALLLDLPDRLYSESSDYVIKLVDSIKSSRDAKLIYCLTYFLWKQNYTYPVVIEIFEKNLSHEDWRIRLITNECLRTWKREYDLINLYVPTPKIFDRIRAKVDKDYEVKLIG